MNSKDLRILITKYKEANQMSNYDVGLEIGISQNTVRRFISGEDILPSTLEKIEKFFTRDCEEKTELEKLKEENALLKEELLKKSETEQALQSTIEAIQDANKRTNQCTEALRQIKFDIEYKLNDELRYCSSDCRTIALAIYYLAKTIEEKKGAENE